MTLVIITLGLVLITVLCFIAGAIGLSKYAFRLGSGPGMMTLLFPPYTFYFAFYKLDQDGKDRPAALWLFGLVATVLLVAIFWTPLSSAARGDFDALKPPPEAPAHKKYVPKSTPPAKTDTTTPAPKTTPDATKPADGTQPKTDATNPAANPTPNTAPKTDGKTDAKAPAAAPKTDGKTAAPAPKTAPKTAPKAPAAN